MKRRLLVGGAALAVGALRLSCRARVPDDYDSIGFVRALDDFDLGKLQPHFPGYPVYVALGKLAHAALPSALDAACAVSALAASATALALWRIARALGGDRAAALAVALYAGAAMPWLLGGAALSDGTATAFAALAFAFLCAPARPLAGGVAIALMLGTRASYWPIAVSFAIVAWPWRRRALAGAAVALCAWAAPFVALVGPRRLLALGRTHLVGHFTIWGGSIAARPRLGERAYFFARDLGYDGIAPNALLLPIVCVLTMACLARPSRAAWRTAAIVAAPYALWAFFAQNVVEQPRHLLPLVVAALVAMALALARRPLLGAAAVVAVAAAGAPLAVARARTLPAAAQAAAYVARAWPAGDVVLVGGRSIRFFDKLPIVRRERTWLADVYVELERLDVLPPHVLVTSEVEGPPSHRAYLTDGPTFCRDARLDRMQPCLTLREYHLPGVVP